MAESKNHFTDGDAYERMMGVWSRLIGNEFLDWLALPHGLRCIDVGCGNGAFTELLVDRCKPSEVQGIDPSPEQIAFARQRHTAKLAEFRVGDAMALPFPDDRFDAGSWRWSFSLCLTRQGVSPKWRGWCAPAERSRPTLGTCRAAGCRWSRSLPKFARSAARRWDRRCPKYRVSMPCMRPGRRPVSSSIETRKITVQRTFADIDDFWATSTQAGTIRTTVAALTAKEIAAVKDRLRAILPADASGRITQTSFANAVKGRVPR